MVRRLSRFVAPGVLLALACTEPEPTPTQLAFLLQPVNVVAGVAMQVSVEVQDRSGRRVTTGTPSILLTLGNNPGGGTLQGGVIAAVEGLATFTGVRVQKAGQGFVLVASASGLTGATSQAFNVTAAPPFRLAFTVFPAAPLVAGVNLTPPPAVAVQDPYGNVVTTSNNLVTMALATSPPGAVLSGSIAVAAVNGVATFPQLQVDRGGNYAFVASSAGLQTASTGVLNVLPGLPVKLGFLSAPIAAPTDTPLSPVVVQIQDANGNQIGNTSPQVTLALGANPGGAVLSGTRTVAASNGQAVFSDLTLNAVGTGYTLVATATGLTGATSPPFLIRLPLGFNGVSAGYFHSCGMALGTQAHCWGDGSKLGSGTTFPSGAAVPVTGGIALVTVTAGRNHSCGLTAAGAGYCWGENASGELGDGTQATRLTPTPVSGGLAFASIAAGYSHTCGITLAGLAYCWGDGGSGQVGDGASLLRLVPTPVTTALTWLTVVPGRLVTCGVATTHAAYCWGVGGILGNGSAQSSSIPVAVSAPGLSFSWVGAGGFHACGLTSAGAAYCWGEGGFGALGNGATSDAGTPVAVSGGLTFASLTVGNRHTCGVTTAGVAYCWGDNSDRTVGDGTADPRKTVPTLVAGGLTFASVSAGRFNTCGVTTGNLAYCWGANYSGQSGNGVSGVSAVPVRVK